MSIAIFLVGTFGGLLLISRLFWLIARGWPDSIRKAIALNIFCFVSVVPLDLLSRDLLSSPSACQERLWYLAAAQILVFLVDLWGVKAQLAKQSPSSAA